MSLAGPSLAPHISLLARVAIACLLACVTAPGQAEGQESINSIKSYHDIPGVTAEEIEAIEALKKEKKYFVYGMALSTEAFLKENGEAGGYAALFCQWLTGLFDIQFNLEVLAWSDLTEKLKTGEVDFSGHIMPDEENLKTYYMTDYIAERQFIIIRLAKDYSLSQILAERPLKYAFISDAPVEAAVSSVTKPGAYEPIWVSDHNEAYRVLKSGKADAFITTNVAKAYFAAYDNVVSEVFFPLIFSQASLATGNPAFKPVISVVNKALRNGVRSYLNEMYEKGYDEYRRHNFFMSLTSEEKEYLQKTVSVPLAGQYFNYPHIFYNDHEKKWDGIAIEVLGEVERLTGLNFKVVNDERTEMKELIQMLIDGQAHIFSDLVFSAKREPHFLWGEYKLMADQYALLSKINFPNVHINQIPFLRVALVKNTAHAEMFRTWFPNALNVTEYENADAAFLALEHGEAEMVMAAKSKLLYYSNYFEFSGYKANYLFDHFYKSAFAFNKDQTILRSLMDKALSNIDTYVIVEQWLTKTYDYRRQIMAAQRPWLIGAVILSLIVFAMILILLYVSRKKEKRLAKAMVEINAANRLKNTAISSLESILNSIDAGIYATVPGTGELLFVNNNVKKLFGKVGVDLMGEYCYKIFRGLDKMCSFCPVHQLEKTPDQMIVWDEYFEGLGQYIRHANCYIDWPSGQKVHLQHIVDITEVIVAQKNAEKNTLAKSEFLSRMSHEMLTPLNSIIGMTQAIKTHDIHGPIKDSFHEIEAASHKLWGLIEDVLDVSDMEYGVFKLINSLFDTRAMFLDLTQMMNSQMSERRHTFQLDIHPDIPLTLTGDEKRLKQAIRKLLENAVKFTPENGVISLAAHVFDETAEAVTLGISVTDNGIGILKENQNKLFDMFEQEDGSLTRKYNGAGLGLVISKFIAEKMGGNISVESEPGQGSKFVFICTLQKALDKLFRNYAGEASPFRPTADTLEPLAPRLAAHADFSGKNILVVDDMSTNRLVVKTILEQTGAEILEAESGEKAVGFFYEESEKIDLILMDIRMPGMDGYEATRKIRASGLPKAGKIPIIALTAQKNKTEMEAASEAGMNCHLAKPIAAQTLINVLKDYLMEL